DALMRPPAPGDQRTAAQRRADAMVDLARGALAHGTLPEVGGERPHIGILITPEILFANPGTTPASTPGGGCPHTTTGDTPARSTATDHGDINRGGEEKAEEGSPSTGRDQRR